jgi:hypothetical protein
MNNYQIFKHNYRVIVGIFFPYHTQLNCLIDNTIYMSLLVFKSFVKKFYNEIYKMYFAKVAIWNIFLKL